MKIKLFKTSFWKSKIKLFIIKLFLIDFKLKFPKDNNNLLIITLDALGDNVVKSKTIEILANSFGKDNTYILCKSKWEEIYKLQNYKNIFVDETKWSIFYKIKLYRKLNKIGFSKIAILNHSHLPQEMNFIVHGDKYDMSESVNYILEKHVIILKKILGKDYSIEEVKPNLKKYFSAQKNKNIITVAVGTADYPKTWTYPNFKKYIEGLMKLKQKQKIFLLGTGKKQKNMVLKLISEIKDENLIDCVDLLNFKELIQLIRDSEFFIGGDSGLYNIAFSLETNTICLHWCKEKTPWEHSGKNIKILKGKGGQEYIDSKYGTDILNSITFEQIKEAINELENKQ